MSRAIRLRFLLLAATAPVLLGSPAAAIDVGTGAPFRQQQFEAWGTSLAWWANGVGGWNDEDAKAELIGRMFDQANGLGLNYARYNIGGGQNRLLGGNFRPGALVQGWVPTAPSSVEDASTWQWNWGADADQRLVLDQALAHGVNRVDAISYSAPYWMTISQDTAGGPGGGDNLLQSHFDEYAHYQTEVVKHFHDNLGVRFQAFSPMNEPHASWWQSGGGQEGMHVSQGFDQRLLIETVGQALQAKGLPIGISAAEEFNASSTANAYNQYNAFTKGFITQINTHVYGGNSTGSLTQVKNLAASEGLRLYQSEYGNNSTTGLQGGVGLASRITQDVNTMGVNGWAYWQVVEPVSLSGAGWGLAWAGYGQSDSDYVIRKQYHVMRQFSSHIRPGSHILTTSDANTVAAYDPATETTVLVITNDGAGAVNKTFDLLDGSPQYSRVIQTSDETNYGSLGPATIAGSDVSLSAPGPSVTTIVLHNRPNLIQNAGFDFAGEPSGSTTLGGGWQATGDAAFYDNLDNTGDGSGGAALRADTAGASGAVWQTGVGDAASDLSGVAYQFSLDALFREEGAATYDANTQVALEFYGADGATLAHADESDFASEIGPIVADSQWRTFRTQVVAAPEGTRFVRPVVRFDGTGPDSDGWVDLDNAYLQEVNYRPRGKSWKLDANASFLDDANWEHDASVEENSNAYLGPILSQAATLTVGSDAALESLTFDSPIPYRLVGDGKLLLGSSGAAAGLIDARDGAHTVQVSVELQADALLRALPGATLALNAGLDAAGNRVSIAGAGDINFTGALELAGGELQLYAREDANVAIGPAAILDGSLDVLFAPGTIPLEGQSFELVTFTGSIVEFEGINLPTLPGELGWDVEYLSSSLFASIIAAPLAGDYNGDGVVDAGDFTVWRDNLGTSNLVADGDGDGDVDTQDFIVWRNNFGASADSAGSISNAGVPEPNAARILGLLAICIASTTCGRNARTLSRKFAH